MTETNKRTKSAQECVCQDGYKNCNGYIIPDEWSVVRFNSLFRRLTRKNAENNQNVLTISAQQGLVSQMDYYNTLYASENKEGYSLLHKGDFSYNKSYSSEYAYGAIKRLDAYDKGIVSPLYICFTPEKGTNSDFYLQYFEAGCFNREIYKIAQEGARNHGLLNVSTEDFFNSALICPPLPEQERIAEILNQCDKVIKLKQKKIDELSAFKKECLRRLFPSAGCSKPEVRFPGFTDDWELRKLSQVFTIRNEKNGDRYTREDVLAVSDTYGCVNQIKFHGRSLAGEDISNYKVVQTGDIIYTKSPLQAKPYGIIKIVGEETGIISPLYVVNETVNGIDPMFMYYLFDTPERTNNYLSHLVRKGAKNTMNISNEEWLSGVVTISPSEHEQKTIGQYLHNLDHLLTLHHQELEEYKSYKTALAKLLLTGIVRVRI